MFLSHVLASLTFSNCYSYHLLTLSANFLLMCLFLKSVLISFQHLLIICDFIFIFSYWGNKKKILTEVAVRRCCSLKPATLLEKKTPTEVFSFEFWQNFWKHFLMINSGGYFCTYFRTLL